MSGARHPNKAASVAAIILGAGQGRRFGGPVRKQYLKLENRPLLWWSLNAFEKTRSIGALILVAPYEDLPALQKQLTAWRFKKIIALVAGGKKRSDSVKQGLLAVPEEFRWVAVHDGVRPLITPDDIEQVIAAAKKHRAALAAAPSRDTVKISDPRGFVKASPDRQTVWLAQTPQIFERRLLERAHGVRARGSRFQAPGAPAANSLEPRATVTDDAQLVERLGVPVKLVEVSATNLKVTLPMDYEFARQILKKRKSA